MTFLSRVARSVLAALAMLPAVVLPSGATAQKAAWQGQVTAYGWAAGIGGDLTPFAGAPTIAFEESFSEVLEDLDAAFFLTGLARSGDLVLLGDVSYAALSNDGLVPPGVPAFGEMTQTSLTLAAGRPVFGDDRTNIDVLAGARAWWIEGEVSVPAAGVSLSPSQSFVDPILALRANRRIADRWSLTGYADLGGFGIGSDLTWQAAVTANYAVSDRVVLSAGYRHLYLDFEEDGTVFDGAMSGPLLGVTIRF